MCYTDSATVYRVAASQSYQRGEVVQMSAYEAISLMIAFSMLILALLAYIDKRK